LNIGIEPQTWFPVVTLVVGIAIKAISDALSESRAFLRNKETLLEERRETARAAHAEFQRTTLLDLQDECQKLARSTALVNHEDVMMYRRTSQWQKTLLSENANEGSRQAFANILKLRVRVADEGIRQCAKDFTSACASVANATSDSMSNKESNRASRLQEDLFEKIGIALRQIHDEQSH
jgi:hypothetical protein